MSEKGCAGESKLKTPDEERRQSDRRVVPEDAPVSAKLTDLGDTTYFLQLKDQNAIKKPPEDLEARLLSNKDVNCAIENISAKGLCVCSMSDLAVGKNVGVHISFEGGIVLICEGVWHKPWSGQKGLGHLTGLNIINISDRQVFKRFIDSLPLLETASA